MIKVSVIIPVYNVEQYIRGSLDSVINQSLKEIEIICVDDGSSDNSGTILDEYASKDSRIKVIHQENKGVATARNKALEVASGEYIGFLDSDDIIDVNFYETLYNQAIKNNLEIVKGGCIIINNSSQNKSKLNDLIKKDGWYCFTHEWWSAIYSSNIIRKNNIKFPDGVSNGEDSVFLNKTLLASQNVGVNNDVLYHYIRRDNSLDTVFLSSKQINSAILSRCIIAENINKSSLYDNNLKAYDYLFYYNITSAFYLLFRTQENNVKKIIIQNVIDIFHKCKNVQYIENNFPYKWIIPYIKSMKYDDLYDILIKYKRAKDLLYPPNSFKNKIFSITNMNNGRKVITILGIKFKI